MSQQDTNNQETKNQESKSNKSGFPEEAYSPIPFKNSDSSSFFPEKRSGKALP